MPLSDISGENRSDAGSSRYPRLKLQANEKARVVVVGPTHPVSGKVAVVKEFLHRFDAPKIVNMAPTYTKITTQEGTEMMVVAKRYVGGSLCLGEQEQLDERGFDESCAACSASRQYPEFFRPAQPRFSVNVLKYGLRPGGSWQDIAQPYGVNSLIWVFGSKIMDRLIDIGNMAQYPDLRLVDLLLAVGGDKDVNFQKPYSNGEFMYDNAAWQSNPQWKQHTIEYVSANGATVEELTAAIGKKAKPDWVADDISRVIQAWDVVRAYEARAGGQPNLGPNGFGAESLQQGMGQLQQQYGGQPQQFGQPGQAYQVGPAGGQGGSSSAPAGNGMPPQQGVQGGGVNMGLLGGHFQPQQEAPQQQFNPGYMEAAQQAAGQGMNPLTAAYNQATGQAMPDPQGWQAPGQTGDMFAAQAGQTAQSAPSETLPAASSNTPSASPSNGANPFATSAMPTGPAQSAAPTASAPGAGIAGAPSSTPGQGTAPGNFGGFGAMGVQQPPAMPTPPPVAETPATAPDGGSWSFEQLAQMGQQAGQQ